MKNKLLILLSFICLFLISCSTDPYAYSYPKEYSAEYCFEQYQLFDPNITYSECYEFVSDKNWGINPSVNFSAIQDCDDLSFMVYYKEAWLVGGVHFIQVVRSRNEDTNPAADFTPLRAELCWYKNIDNPDTQEIQKLHCYESEFLSQTVVLIDNSEAVNEIMNIAVRNTVLSPEAFLQEQKETVNQSELHQICTEDGTLYVKICFNECPGLLLIGKILTDENGYSYLEHIVYYSLEGENAADVVELKRDRVTDSNTWSFYYRLGENMDAFVHQIADNSSTDNNESTQYNNH